MESLCNNSRINGTNILMCERLPSSADVKRTCIFRSSRNHTYAPYAVGILLAVLLVLLVLLGCSITRVSDCEPQRHLIAAHQTPRSGKNRAVKVQITLIKDRLQYETMQIMVRSSEPADITVAPLAAFFSSPSTTTSPPTHHLPPPHSSTE